MLFRILGPVAVDGPDGEVSLGGPRHRVLLATLLTAPGRVVPAERLIEAMWGDEPPRRAVEILHVRVSELRKLLREGSEAELILTRRPGYLLDVTPDDIDAHRFADAAAAGRRALADGDAEGASARLSAALADWRGSVLVELAERPFAQVEIARWEHLRRQALADRIDADLLAGRHREVLAELEA
ncbi:MAG: BTAD domain-containing putative transcriptional regulator, partial [Pseudonocardia sp.]